MKTKAAKSNAAGIIAKLRDQIATLHEQIATLQEKNESLQDQLDNISSLMDSEAVPNRTEKYGFEMNVAARVAAFVGSTYAHGQFFVAEEKPDGSFEYVN